MFQRRITLLWCAAAGVALLQGAQMTRLAVGQGGERLAAAQHRLDLVNFLPTYRGRILDRHGRALAEDRPGYDVAVEYEVITGAWALKQAAHAAHRAAAADWAEMSPADREAAVAGRLPEFEQRLERLWEAVTTEGGIDRAELARRLDAIKREVQTTAAVVWDRQLREEIRFGAVSPGDVMQRRPIREQRDAHVILPDVDKTVAFAFRRLASEAGGALPGVRVLDSHGRHYPWTTMEVTIDRSGLPRPVRSREPLAVTVHGVADHILGSMRDEVWADDVERRPFVDRVTGEIDLGGYRAGDRVGTRGLERVFEDQLRGERGVLRRRLDSGDVQRIDYTPGTDLTLTIDIDLQARIQALLSAPVGLTTSQQFHAGWHPDRTPRPTAAPRGTTLNAAAVVLDVESGEILALVTTPTIADAAGDACAASRGAWVNRAVEAIYPPGSIVKPLVLAAAVGEGVHGLDDPIECVGHYLPERADVLRCWVYRPPAFATHGAVTAEASIARSCNIYFYTLGERLGLERLGEWFRRFGVGRALDVGLLYETETPGGGRVPAGEAAGTLPAAEDVSRLRAAGELRFAAAIMGTGQGPVTWTPLHAANAYALLARGGVWRPPTLVRGGHRAAGENVPIDDEVVTAVLEGLRQSVAEPYGTGNHITYPDGTFDPIINVEGVTVWAKTGTAQAPPGALDLDCDGEAETPVVDPSHAWFVGLAGAGSAAHARPRVAIAVVVEYGGSGGRTAGPVANEIIRLLKSAGYLGAPPA